MLSKGRLRVLFCRVCFVVSLFCLISVSFTSYSLKAWHKATISSVCSIPAISQKKTATVSAVCSISVIGNCSLTDSYVNLYTALAEIEHTAEIVVLYFCQSSVEVYIWILKRSAKVYIWIQQCRLSSVGSH